MVNLTDMLLYFTLWNFMITQHMEMLSTKAILIYREA